MLLSALEKGDASAVELSAQQRAVLTAYPDVGVQKRASALLKPNASRQSLIDEYTRRLGELRGESASGKALFSQACAACHNVAGVGHEVGPNLAAFVQRGSDAVIANVLDPSLVIGASYQARIVVTDDSPLPFTLLSVTTELKIND